MTKRKRNILIIAIACAVVLLAAAVGVVYAAYTIVVNYNYNVKAYSNLLDIDFSSGVLTVTQRHETSLTATKADIVIITPDGEVTISDIPSEGTPTDYACTKYTKFEVGGEMYRKSVFTDVALTGNATGFTVTGSAEVIPLKAQMSEAEYEHDLTDSGGTVVGVETRTVVYDNIYISSFNNQHYNGETTATDCLEFELMNFQTDYNDMLELWNNYYENKTIARNVFLLDDVTVKEDYTIIIPCSINLLASTLTVADGATLKIAHPYAGQYYISGGSVAVAGQTLSGALKGELLINTPKAYYRVDDVANDSLNNIDIADYGKAYTDVILEDAVDFALEAIPHRTFTTFILPLRYRTYGISFEYHFTNDDGKYIDFSGRVSDTKEDTALLRGTSTKSYIIDVTATASGGGTEHGSKTAYVIGTGDGAVFTDMLDEIGRLFKNPDEDSLNAYITPDLDIYTLLYEAYTVGKFEYNISISLYEDAYMPGLTDDEEDEAELAWAQDEDTTLTKEQALEKAAIDKELAALASGIPVTLVVGYTDGSLKSIATRNAVFGYENGAVCYEDGEGDMHPVNYVHISKGLATVSETLTIEFTAVDGSDPEAEFTSYPRTYDLAVSARNEVIYYLKTVMPAFLTNKAYPMLSVKTDDETVGGVTYGRGLYSGNSHLTHTLLDIEDIDFEFWYVNTDDNGELITDPGIPPSSNGPVKAETEEYWVSDEEGGAPERVGNYYLWTDPENPGSAAIRVLAHTFASNTCATPSEDTYVPKNMYLKYTVTFDAQTGDTFEIYIQVIKSLATEGGDNQQFESSNPFDELFMSSETVWIEGGTFTVPSTNELHYAQIEIVSIDGVPYELLDPASREYNMITIEGDPSGSHNFLDDVTGGLTEDDVPHMQQRLAYEGQIEDPAVKANRYMFYKTLKVITHRDYVPDYNTSVRFMCYYATTGTSSAIVLRQEYLITVNGIFKCEGWEEEEAGVDYSIMTPYVFYNEEFYGITIQMFEDTHSVYASDYVATLESGKKILLSDSAYATGELDYTGLTAVSGVDVRGIDRLKRVTSINLSGVLIADMSAFALMYDSALETLRLGGCGLSDAALYGSGNASSSYLYEIQLKEADLSGNMLSRTDRLLSRTVTNLDLSDQNGNLTDIAGLSNLTSLRTLDVQNNDIYRFDVLRKLTVLERVYICGNAPFGAGDDYGTNGRLNIPTYVAVIKDYDTRIYVDSVSPHVNYIKINRDDSRYQSDITDMTGYFDGSGITAQMEIGSVALNAFASPAKIYSTGGGSGYLHDGITTLIDEVSRLKVFESGSGWGGGVGNGSDTVYLFKFYDPADGSLSADTVTLINDEYKSQYTRVNIGGNVISNSYTINAGTVCSYVLAAVDESTGEVLAYREFLVTVMYTIGV